MDSLYFAGSKRQSEAQAEPGDFREIPEDEELKNQVPQYDYVLPEEGAEDDEA